MICFNDRLFANRTMHALIVADLSYRDAAKRCGLTQTTMREIATGSRRPSLRSAMAIAEKLIGKPLQEFTGERR